MVTLGIALFHGRLQHLKRQRRYVKLDDTSLEIRTSPLRRLTLQWTDLTSVDLTASKAVFHRTNGRRHTVKFLWYHNSDAVRRGIADHAAAAGLLHE
jgi:hypothetical protein